MTLNIAEDTSENVSNTMRMLCDKEVELQDAAFTHATRVIQDTGFVAAEAALQATRVADLAMQAVCQVVIRATRECKTVAELMEKIKIPEK